MSVPGIAIIALIFISIFEFVLIAKKHGLKFARRQSDEYAAGGAFFISFVIGIIIFIYIVDNYIPKSERWPNAAIYAILFIWLWGRICSFIADFFNE